MNLCDLNEIRRLLDKYGFKFSKSKGQNFLIDESIPKRIAASADLDEGACALEIGPGMGCLTQELSALAAKVVAVELDRTLLPLLSETMGGLDNVEIIQGDILKLELPKLVEERFAGLRPVVCANLPYNISTAVLTLLLQSKLFSPLVVMVQKEVAERICSEAGSGAYGSFTVFCNYYSRVRPLFDVAPQSFHPRPKVTSTVLRFDRLDSPPAHIEDETLFFRLVRASFAQRRKQLVNGLASAFGESLSKDEIRAVLVSLGFSETVRGERLSLQDFARLSNAIGGLL